MEKSKNNSIFDALVESHYKAVVLKLGSTEPQGFDEAVAGVRLRSE